MTGIEIPFSFNRITTPQEPQRTVTVGSSLVIFDVTSDNASFISVTATIPNPVSLNGTTMTCNGQTLQLNVEPTSKRHYSAHIKSTVCML